MNNLCAKCGGYNFVCSFTGIAPCREDHQDEGGKHVWVPCSHGHPVQEEERKKCDCGCHSAPSSSPDMKENGCDLCYWNSEYHPRHPKPAHSPTKGTCDCANKTLTSKPPKPASCEICRGG